jgi:hypothetical protein
VTHRSHVKLAYEELEGSLVPIVALTRVSLWPRSAGPKPEMDPCCDPEVRHGGRCRLTMFRKQVFGPGDGLHPPSWPRRRSRSSELEERPAHGSNPSFCALHGLDAGHRDQATRLLDFTVSGMPCLNIAG